MKKTLVLAIVLLICAWLAVGIVHAEPVNGESDFAIDGTTLVSYTGAGGEVTVPEGIEVLGNNAFMGTNVTKVNLPSTLKEIGSYCFLDCALLSDITLPASVENIEYTYMDGYAIGQAQVFGRNPNLRGIKVEAGNEHYVSIDGILFTKDEKKLLYYPAGKNAGGSYTIPEGTETIGYTAFDGASFTVLRLPASMVSMGASELMSNSALREITADPESAYFKSIDGVLYTADEKTLIAYPNNKAGEELTGGDFPDGIAVIGEFAFSGNKNLKTVSLPETVTSIHWAAFSSASALKEITLPASLESIGGNAFIYCYKLARVTVLNPEVEFPEEGFNPFNGSASVVLYGYEGSTAEAFAAQYDIDFVFLEENPEDPISGTCGENLTWTLDEDGVLTISGSGSMKDFDWDSMDAWRGQTAAVTSVIINDGVTSIGSYAFSQCASLNSVTIPDSVTRIEYEAFWNCNRLSAFHVASNNPVFSSLDGVIFDKNQTTLICHPCGKLGTYVIPSSVTNIGERAFMSSSLSAVEIPDSVTTISERAFIYCFNLIDIEIPNSVTRIEDEAFWNCNSLTSVTIPKNVTFLGDAVFGSCYSLTNIYVETENPVYASKDGVLFNKELSTLLYYPTAKAGAYTIPSSVTHVANSAFMHCNKLTSVTIPQGVSCIGRQAFYSSTLTDITIPRSVTIIDVGAFHRCSLLTDVYFGGTEEEWNAISIYSLNSFLMEATLHTMPVVNLILPSALTKIESQAFANLPDYTVVLIPAGVTSIADDAFANVSGLIIIGTPGSEAEAFADAHDGVTFIPVNE